MPSPATQFHEITQREINRLSVTPQEREGLRTGFLVPENVSWRERLKKSVTIEQAPQPAPAPAAPAAEPPPVPEPETETDTGERP